MPKPEPPFLTYPRSAVGVAGPPITGLPPIWVQQDGGLMDIALHPRFAETRLVYLSYTKPMGERGHTSALMRGRLEDGRVFLDASLMEGGELRAGYGVMERHSVRW